MNRIFARLLVLAMFLVATGEVLAAAVYSCYVSPNPASTLSMTYDFGSTTSPTSISNSFTVTCQKDTAGSASNLTVTIAANSGLQPSPATQNRAKLGSSFINYSVDTASPSAACTPQWSASNQLSNVFIFNGGNPGGNPPQSKVLTYYGCIVKGLVTMPAGTYADTVTMTLTVASTSGAGTASITGAPFTFPVSIIVTAACTISTAPGTITFNYTALGSVQTANTSFATTCTSALPYSMSLDRTSDVVSGLNYTLALNTSASGGSNPLNSNGTGVAQTFFVNGSMASGQAGTCATGSCNVTNPTPHTLTVSY